LGGAVWWFMPNVPLPRTLERWPMDEAGWTLWEPWYQGVSYARASYRLPRPLKAHALRIDLSAPGVEVFMNGPSVPHGTNCAALYATDFVLQHGLEVVVSAGAFLPFAKWRGTLVEPIGIAISDGVEWRPPVGNLHSVVFTRDHRVRLTPHQADTADAWQAVGGNLIILRGGTNTMEPLENEPCSVVGHSADGRTLYWLIVDGRQPGWSEGATPGESAEMMRALGATDALRMDGGSVVTLAKTSWLGPRVVNRPSHPYITGVQRPIGSLIGIHARPLP